MSLQIFHPESREAWLQLRTQDITSTDVATLFGFKPYANSPTLEQLFNQKLKRVITDFKASEAMEWGDELQDAIAGKLARDRGWTTESLRGVYMRNPELRAGASFDHQITAPFSALFEIKNVAEWPFRSWLGGKRGFLAPPHIELQVQHQLLVSGATLAKIGVLVGGHRGMVDERLPDPVVQRAIVQKVRQFWAWVEAGKLPVLNPLQRAGHYGSPFFLRNERIPA